MMANKYITHDFMATTNNHLVYKIHPFRNRDDLFKYTLKHEIKTYWSTFVTRRTTYSIVQSAAGIADYWEMGNINYPEIPVSYISTHKDGNVTHIHIHWALNLETEPDYELTAWKLSRKLRVGNTEDVCKNLLLHTSFGPVPSIPEYGNHNTREIAKSTIFELSRVEGLNLVQVVVDYCKAAGAAFKAIWNSCKNLMLSIFGRAIPLEKAPALSDLPSFSENLAQVNGAAFFKILKLASAFTYIPRSKNHLILYFDLLYMYIYGHHCGCVVDLDGIVTDLEVELEKNYPYLKTYGYEPVPEYTNCAYYYLNKNGCVPKYIRRADAITMTYLLHGLSCRNDSVMVGAFVSGGQQHMVYPRGRDDFEDRLPSLVVNNHLWLPETHRNCMEHYLIVNHMGFDYLLDGDSITTAYVYAVDHRTYFVQQKPHYPLIKAVFERTDKSTPTEEKLVLPTYIPEAPSNQNRSEAKRKAKAAKKEKKVPSTGWESANIIDLSKTLDTQPDQADTTQADTTTMDSTMPTNTECTEEATGEPVNTETTIPQPNTDGLTTVLLTPKVQNAGGIIEVYEEAGKYYPQLKQYARGLKDNKAVSVKVAGDSIMIQYRNKKTQSEYTQHFKNLVDGFRAKEGLIAEEAPAKNTKKNTKPLGLTKYHNDYVEDIYIPPAQVPKSRSIVTTKEKIEITPPTPVAQEPKPQTYSDAAKKGNSNDLPYVTKGPLDIKGNLRSKREGTYKPLSDPCDDYRDAISKMRINGMPIQAFSIAFTALFKGAATTHPASDEAQMLKKQLKFIVNRRREIAVAMRLDTFSIDEKFGGKCWVLSEYDHKVGVYTSQDYLMFNVGENYLSLQFPRNLIPGSPNNILRQVCTTLGITLHANHTNCCLLNAYLSFLSQTHLLGDISHPSRFSPPMRALFLRENEELWNMLAGGSTLEVYRFLRYSGIFANMHVVIYNKTTHEIEVFHNPDERTWGVFCLEVTNNNGFGHVDLRFLSVENYLGLQGIMSSVGTIYDAPVSSKNVGALNYDRERLIEIYPALADVDNIEEQIQKNPLFMAAAGVRPYIRDDNTTKKILKELNDGFKKWHTGCNISCTMFEHWCKYVSENYLMISNVVSQTLVQGKSMSEVKFMVLEWSVLHGPKLQQLASQRAVKRNMAKMIDHLNKTQDWVAYLMNTDTNVPISKDGKLALYFMSQELNKAFELWEKTDKGSKPLPDKKVNLPIPDPDDGYPEKPDVNKYNTDWCVVDKLIGGSDVYHTPSDLNAAWKYYQWKNKMRGIGSNFSWATEVLLMRTRVVGMRKFEPKSRGFLSKYLNTELRKDWELEIETHFVTALYCDVTRVYEPKHAYPVNSTFRKITYHAPAYFLDSLQVAITHMTQSNDDLRACVSTMESRANVYLASSDPTYLNDVKQLASLYLTATKNRGNTNRIYCQKVGHRKAQTALLGRLVDSRCKLPPRGGTASYKIQFTEEQARTRHVAWVSSGYHYEGACLNTYDTRNPNNSLMGCLARLTCKTEDPDESIGEEYKNFADALYDWILGDGEFKLIPVEDYIRNHKSYSSARKQQLLEEYRLFQSSPDFDMLFNETKLGTFIKSEWYMDFNKLPRLINPRGDLIKCIYGAFVASMEAHCYPRLEKFLVKGLSGQEKMKKIIEIFGELKNLKNSDFTKFESSLKKFLHKRVEMNGMVRYARKFNMEKLIIAIILAMANGPYILKANLFTAIIEEMRASGDNVTAFFNALQQLFANLYCYWRREHAINRISMESFIAREMPRDSVDSKITMVVEGDDGLHHHTEVEIDASDYKRLGITADILTKSTIYESSFCSQRFSTTRKLFYDPIKFLLKFGWLPARYHGSSQKRLDTLLAAKCLSYMCTYTQCPVVYPICHAIFKRLGRRVTMRDIDAVISKFHSENENYMEFQNNIPDYDNCFETKCHYAEVYNFSPFDLDVIVTEFLQMRRSTIVDLKLSEEHFHFYQEGVRHCSQGYSELSDADIYVM